ncbi:hypothetical protein EK0264_18910 [Epidermidibacterium keratini]|uniref:Uncharacterized protein n=1 Tax=Epidermidibacterium keratini TaxID=1891644 RepID=A0A7L4YSI4_9ACTN|nr:hypothetical protein [Epidermidibacterium keratini]QHC02136.1 hypothetical protein EK0264_18910 [Epidermidibacterium keratini]
MEPHIETTQVGFRSRAVDTLIGIDDTDNDTSPGTGYLAQRLLESLEDSGLAAPVGATRHQLLKDPRVPYTSHNSAACLAVASERADLTPVIAHCADFLTQWSAEGSDPGLCVADHDLTAPVQAALASFGHRTKVDLQTQTAARSVAARNDVFLAGYGGTEDGVIGALAAVGLHRGGSDGFFLWLPGLRDLRPGRLPFDELCATLPIDDARTLDGRRPAATESIRVHPWVRPALIDGAAVLLLDDSDGWSTAPREAVRAL